MRCESLSDQQAFRTLLRGYVAVIYGGFIPASVTALDPIIYICMAQAGSATETFFADIVPGVFGRAQGMLVNCFKNDLLGALPEDEEELPFDFFGLGQPLMPQLDEQILEWK
ncbi:hypothetical protein ACJX0J_015589, partial [Zea mays]